LPRQDCDGTLTVGRLAELCEAGARPISLSVDGSTAEIHDPSAVCPGFTAGRLAGRAELGLKVQINTTVTGHDLADLADIAALVHRLGAISWRAFLLVPTGRGKPLPPPTAQQAEDVMNFVYGAGQFVPARTTEAHHVRRVVLQREVLARHGADHVVPLGLGPLYLRLRQRLALPRLGPHRGPYAEDPWCSYQPGTFPYPSDLVAMGLRSGNPRE
jgi:MoaA/NifB/PqqE/SkfB family radical SAM enzyme